MGTAGSPLPNPFPGLRPFRSDEHHLFFGRNEQTAALLQLLRKKRFIAVVGTSGSGKSSLVRAGMIAELHGGTMTRAGSSWEVLILRPGGNPVANLARAFVDAELYDAEDPSTLPRLLATLGRSRFGLVEAMKQSEVCEPGTNLLVVVDQFEELFRFRQQGVDSEETAAGFVNLLLTACDQSESPVYVAITMRSDYLGDCSKIPGLAEAVNEGEYLIPRLSRDQKREAIERPIGVGGATMSPLLVQQLLNEIGDDPDQLPVLQHALMRMWDAWSAGGDRKRPIDLVDFEATGGLASALSNHADEIYDSLPDDRHRFACEKIFKTLTVKGDDNRGIRRPTALVRLQAIAAADRPTVTTVLDAFRRSGVTFLMPGTERELEDRTVVDLSHESLMRCWRRLRGWVEDEAQSARIFRRLSETARLWSEGKAGLFRDPDLQIAMSWRRQERPNEEWAEQYGGGFDAAIGFLQKSNAEAEAERQAREAGRQRELAQARELAESRQQRLEHQQRSARRLRKLIAGLAAVALIAGLASVVALMARNEASRLADVAEREADKARQSEETAKQNASRAERSKQEADQARAAAEQSRAAALAETYRAMLSEVRALRAGQQLGWREEALADLARLAVLPTPRRDPVELRTEAVASLGEFSVREVARIEPGTWTHGQLDFSPDSQTLLTVDSDGALDLWDVPGRRHLERLANVLPETSGRKNVLFLADGELAFVAPTGEVAFLGASGGRSDRKSIERAGFEARMLDVDRQGRWLGVGWSDGRIDLIDARTGVLKRSFAGYGLLLFALSPDGERLALRDREGNLQILPTSGEGPPLRFAAGIFPDWLALGPDGATLAGTVGRSLVLWDLDARKESINLGGHRETITGVAFSPDGSMVATTCGDHLVRIWDARDGRALTVLHGPDYMVGLAFSPDGRYLAASASSGVVCIYQLEGCREQRRLAGHQFGVRCLAFHPRLPRFASGSDDNDIIVWDAEPARRLGRWKAQTTWVRGLAYSPDGSLLASACGTSDEDDIDHSIHLWDAENGQPWKSLERTSRWGIHTLAFDSSGFLLASGDQGGEVVTWDLESGEILRKENLDGSPVSSVVFVNDDLQVLAGTVRGTVALLDVEGSGTSRRIELPQGCTRLVVDEPGRRVLVGDSKGGLSALTLSDLAVVHHVVQAHEDGIDSLSLSPDGRLLATGGNDRHVVLRDPLTFEAWLTFPAWTGAVVDLGFDASGRWLAYAGADSLVALWDLGTVREELADLGLAWDRPAPAAPPAGLDPEGEHAPPEVPVIRPWNTDPAAFAEARRLVRSGVDLYGAGRRTEAIRDLQQGRDRFRALHEASPKDDQVASQLAISLGFLGSALRDEERPAEALEAVQECQVLEAMRQPGPGDLYNLACSYSNLSILSESGSAPPTAAEREGLVARAMETLRRALAAGMKDFALIDRDHDLDPLRDRPDFRALILESTGRTREALPLLAQLSASSPEDTGLSLKVAALQAWFGQEAELAATRKRILSFAEGTDDGHVVDCAVRACCIPPVASNADLEAALALARSAGKLEQDGEWTPLALGMAEYRNGHYSDADSALLAAEEAGPNDPTVTTTAGFFRSMSLFRQERFDEARRLAIAAAAKMKPLPPDEDNPLAGDADENDLVLWLAYKEAKGLIEFDADPTPTGQDGQ